MNSWNQNNTNMQVGQANFSPYMYSPTNFNRFPVYTATPIHGRDAALQFPMGVNSEIYLPDADEDIIWWIRTDNMGNHNVQAFDVKPHEEPKSINMNQILERLSALEEKVNAKQNKSNAKRTNSTIVADIGTVAPD